MESPYSKVYTVPYRMSGSEADAQDLKQAAFLGAYRRFDSFGGGAYRSIKKAFKNVLGCTQFTDSWLAP